MNATVVIPTYWAGDDACANAPGTYDHSTRLNADNPELDRCLASLEQVCDIPRIILLVVCPVSATADVSLRVHEIVDAHPTLKVTVVTNTQASRIADRVAQIAPKGSGECVSLRGYGAIRNMGLACAAVLGHDAVIFLDDDETVIDADFMKRATYALGQQTRQGLPILVKSGYFYDRAAGSHGQGGHLPSLVDQAHRVQPLDEKGALGHPHLALQLRVRRPDGPARPRLYACGL
jgi:hypothetical protein